MNILGLSCFYHDSAACIIQDGRLVAAAQEERFSLRKHDWRFPVNAVHACLEEAGLTIRDISLVAFYEKPFLKFERVLETFLAVAPRGALSFMDIIPSWLRQKLRIPEIVSGELGYDGKIIFVEHHEAHAASAFFPSTFEEAAVLTLDGVGEYATASYGIGRGHTLSLTHEMQFPHSLGLLYSAFTAFLGFEVNDAEYKVMGMAACGSPVYRDLILREMVRVNKDGTITLNMEYFPFLFRKKMFNGRWEKLFGISARIPEGAVEQNHYDIAASLQKVLEESVLTIARHIRSETGMRDLCLAGGVALNSACNGRLLREGIFERVYIQPAAGDAGAAIGAAYAGHHLHLNRADRHPLESIYLGPAYPVDDTLVAGLELERHSVTGRHFDERSLVEAAARLLADGKVLGWYQGRMEFGPRALGNRSILADPSRKSMKDTVNRMVKFREEFRPFAPVVTREDAARFFEMDGDSPYMLMTFPVSSDFIPAVTHADGSARVQTVTAGQNSMLYALLKAFERLSGIPVLLNTSLNVRGEAIACKPEDAMRCFLKSGMDALVLGNFLLEKQ